MIIIPKGEHYSTEPIYKLSKSSRFFKGYFTDSCRYDLGDIDQYDINKLFGIGAINSGLFSKTATKKWWEFHKDYSVRLGWRYSLEHKNIELFAYMYVHGMRKHVHLCSVAIGEIFSAKVSMGKDYLLVSVADESGLVIGRHKEKVLNPKTTWLMVTKGAYFGGNKVAPNNMIIHTLIQK